MEIRAVDPDDMLEVADNFKYKIKPVKGDRTLVKGESEILPSLLCVIDKDLKWE